MKAKLFFLCAVLAAIVSNPLSANGLLLTDPCVNCDHFFYVGIEGGYQTFAGVPQFGYAFTSPGANQPTSPFDTFSINKNPNGVYFAPMAKVRIPIDCFFNTTYKLVPHEVFVQASGNFFQSSFKKNINENNAGILLVLPINGVTMSNPLFAIGEVKRNFDYKTYDVELSTSYSACLFGQRIVLEPLVAFSLGYLDQDYTIQANVFPGLLNHLRVVENLKTSYYDYGVGLKGDLPLICHLSLFAKGVVYLTSTDTHLDSSIGFNAPAGFNIIKTDRHDLSPTFRCQSGLLYQIWRAELVLVGRYEFRNAIGAILNPVVLNAGAQPLERFPSLQKDSFSNYSFGVRLGITL